MRRWLIPLAALPAALLALAGCTAGGSAPPSTPASTTTRTVVHTTAPDTGPIIAGPTTSAKADCPYIPKQTAAGDVGMRLAKITVQSSGGKPIGCEFFPLTHPTAQCPTTCLDNERLPPASQPVLRILATGYPSTNAAHNAMVRTAERGTNAQQVKVGPGVTGLAYQTDFYPADHGKDWAVAFSTGTTLVSVSTVVTNTYVSAVTVAKRIAPKFR